MNTLGAAIRTHRLAHGWSQAELSRRTGIAQSYISLLEGKGGVKVSGEKLSRLATTFGISIDSLLQGVFEVDTLHTIQAPQPSKEKITYPPSLAEVWDHLSAEDRAAIEGYAQALWERRHRQRKQPKMPTPDLLAPREEL